MDNVEKVMDKIFDGLFETAFYEFPELNVEEMEIGIERAKEEIALLEKYFPAYLEELLEEKKDDEEVGD